MHAASRDVIANSPKLRFIYSDIKDISFVREEKQLSAVESAGIPFTRTSLAHFGIAVMK